MPRALPTACPSSSLLCVQPSARPSSDASPTELQRDTPCLRRAGRSASAPRWLALCALLLSPSHKPTLSHACLLSPACGLASPPQQLSTPRVRRARQGGRARARRVAARPPRRAVQAQPRQLQHLMRSRSDTKMRAGARAQIAPGPRAAALSDPTSAFDSAAARARHRALEHTRCVTRRAGRAATSARLHVPRSAPASMDYRARSPANSSSRRHCSPLPASRHARPDLSWAQATFHRHGTRPRPPARYTTPACVRRSPQTSTAASPLARAVHARACRRAGCSSPAPLGRAAPRTKRRAPLRRAGMRASRRKFAVRRLATSAKLAPPTRVRNAPRPAGAVCGQRCEMRPGKSAAKC